MDTNRKGINGQEQPDKLANRGHGPEGVDKAPGEEPSQDNVQFTQQTQKGKQSVDADPDRQEDRAIDEQDI
ncbi:hypothetical protein [Flaviaesturariibacter aridisoli]|uniref:Uncharacterized protein n=1 Tax=Flaviaesturariibacter aridisoli TaxID=2545761 RepID=A0A4R4DQ84_9BACT|nr:hypothetical protein [Flaviaesturariibacter aridisoli]TCZ64183.1 hypothetical protein E0486_18335 [Flaviaesturariibacter aridisoli]